MGEWVPKANLSEPYFLISSPKLAIDLPDVSIKIFVLLNSAVSSSFKLGLFAILTIKYLASGTSLIIDTTSFNAHSSSISNHELGLLSTILRDKITGKSKSRQRFTSSIQAGFNKS